MTKPLTAIETELQDVGRRYLADPPSNADALRSVVHQAIELGMEFGAIALVSGVPVEDIKALSW
jgi:hypothetical protein